MDKISVTPFSGTLVESPVNASPAWSMSDDHQSQQKPKTDILAMPERLNNVPEWLRTPLYRFLRLKQRNWPVKTVRRSTRQLFNRVNHITSFFIQHFRWSEWKQLTLHWLEEYIDARLREGMSPSTINWDLIYFRALCQFVVEEGYEVPKAILKLKVLESPQRLPRPLSTEQVRRLERGIQKAIVEAKTEFGSMLAVRDLACFYLLWHCGLRLIDLDLGARKLFIHNSKERKDRIAYMSDTAALSVQQYLAIRPDPDSIYLFTTQHGALHPRSLQRRLVHYSHQCGVPVTAQRLRHTFVSQMLAAGMPVSSLQRYLGHEHLDTTMIYAEVSDPLLRQDYYQGIATLDPCCGKLSMSGLGLTQQRILRQLVEELKTLGMEQSRHDEILDIILANIR